MPEFFVNTRRTEDCSYLIEADNAVEARRVFEERPQDYLGRRDVLESREDVDSVEPASAQ